VLPEFLLLPQEAVQEAETRLREILGCTVVDANNLEGEDPEDVVGMIWRDHQRMKEVLSALKREQKNQKPTGLLMTRPVLHQ